MKRSLTTSFVLAIISIASASAIAQSPSNGTSSTDTGMHIPIKKDKWNPGRPEMPSQQRIECVYADGTLHFFFAIPEGECTLTVTDSFSGISTQYSFDSAAPAEIYVGEILTGSIEILTANGHEYAGIIE